MNLIKSRPRFFPSSCHPASTPFERNTSTTVTSKSYLKKRNKLYLSVLNAQKSMKSHHQFGFTLKQILKQVDIRRFKAFVFIHTAETG